MPADTKIGRSDEAVFRGPTVTVCVVSADKDLVSACREAVRELEEEYFESAPLADPHDSPHSEIWVWDYEPGQTDVPEASSGDSKILYVVSFADLDSLRSRIPSAEGKILLKPVTRVMLRTFLGSVAKAGNGSRLGNGVLENSLTLRADRDELLQCLLHANLKLQEYDQQRTNFLARAVHDFRAPLTALAGFCGLLACGELGPLSEEQTEAIGRMEKSIRRLSRMASAMFDLSTGPRLGQKPNLREADICEHIRQSIHEILPSAREKNIELRADRITPSPRPLHFEPSQIEQVILNLLDNSCKFVPKNGLIEVQGYPYFWERRFVAGNISVERRQRETSLPNSYRIDIRDNGPGVPPHLLEEIFEEYTSYSGSQDRSGGGLGLAICRLIMSRHQGHVWAEASQHGAVFSMVLPFVREEQRERRA